MSNDFELNAEARSDQGKGASRRLRRLADKVPAVIYGGKKKAESITFAHKDIHKALANEAFYSHIITLNVEGKSQQAILKDLQRHPAKDVIMHADFLRVSANQKLQTHVPLHFINEAECIGVKIEGGVISHLASDAEISCLPKNLPEYLEIDMIDIANGAILHLSDIKLPKGVELVALTHGEDHDLPIVNVHTPKGSADDDEPAEDAESDEAAAEGDAEE